MHLETFSFLQSGEEFNWVVPIKITGKIPFFFDFSWLSGLEYMEKDKAVSVAIGRENGNSTICEMPSDGGPCPRRQVVERGSQKHITPLLCNNTKHTPARLSG